MAREQYKYRVSLENEYRAEACRTILAYEAARDGISMGQAFLRLMEGTVETRKYPAELRNTLMSIKQHASDEAARAVCGKADEFMRSA